MASHLIVVCRFFAEDAVLDWVRFRIAEGVDRFHAVMPDGPGAEERLAVFMRRVRASGAAVSGEVSSRPPERMLRAHLQRDHFAGAILAAEGRPYARLPRKLDRLQRRHQIGIVWVVSRALPDAEPGESIPAPPARVGAHGPVTDRPGGGEAAA